MEAGKGLEKHLLVSRSPCGKLVDLMKGSSEPYIVIEQWGLDTEDTGGHHQYEGKDRGRSDATEWQVLLSVCLPLKGHVRKRRGEPVDKQRDVAFTKRHNYRKKASEEKECGTKWK